MPLDRKPPREGCSQQASKRAWFQPGVSQMLFGSPAGKDNLLSVEELQWMALSELLTPKKDPYSGRGKNFITRCGDQN